MNVINQALNLGDLVKYEEDCLNYSRDVVTVEAGQNLPLGCIVGRVTTTGKVKQLDPGAEDGSHLAVGILLGEVDATLIDREDAGSYPPGHRGRAKRRPEPAADYAPRLARNGGRTWQAQGALLCDSAYSP